MSERAKRVSESVGGRVARCCGVEMKGAAVWPNPGEVSTAGSETTEERSEPREVTRPGLSVLVIVYC